MLERGGERVLSFLLVLSLVVLHSVVSGKGSVFVVMSVNVLM